MSSACHFILSNLFFLLKDTSCMQLTIIIIITKKKNRNSAARFFFVFAIWEPLEKEIEVGKRNEKWKKMNQRISSAIDESHSRGDTAVGQRRKS